MIKDYFKLIQYKEQQNRIEEIKSNIFVYENIGILNLGNVYQLFNKNTFSKIKDKKTRLEIQSDLSKAIFYNIMDYKKSDSDIFNNMKLRFFFQGNNIECCQ